MVKNRCGLQTNLLLLLSASVLSANSLTSIPFTLQNGHIVAMEGSILGECVVTIVADRSYSTSCRYRSSTKVTRIIGGKRLSSGWLAPVMVRQMDMNTQIICERKKVH